VEKVFVAQQIAKKLYAAEASLDSAISEAAELMTAIVKARQDLNLAATVDAKASAKLIDTLTALGQARTAIVGCHKELDEVRLRVGIRTRMGGFQDKPPEVAPATQDLREVG
jgi:hypothetical protein